MKPSKTKTRKPRTRKLKAAPDLAIVPEPVHEPAVCPNCLRYRETEAGLHARLDKAITALNTAREALSCHNYLNMVGYLVVVMQEAGAAKSIGQRLNEERQP